MLRRPVRILKTAKKGPENDVYTEIDISHI